MTACHGGGCALATVIAAAGLLKLLATVCCAQLAAGAMRRVRVELRESPIYLPAPDKRVRCGAVQRELCLC